jgi:polar amino acid transport system substrate-binding protein
VGFRKDNAALRDEFNRFLAKLKKDGVLADMVKRWVEQGNTALPAPNNTGANGELVVGISDGTLPFVAVKDNQLTGFDIELSERFGAHLGKRVRYSNMPFDSLIAAVASGKVDMIINSIFITDERKQSIHFSDPYYEEGVLAFGLKKNISAYDGIADTGPAMTFSERITRSFHNNIIAEQRYLLLWDGLKTTLIIAIGSALFGTLLGALICWMRMSPAPALHWPARAIIGFLRGIPVLVLLMLIFYVAFASVDIHAVLVAVFAFGLNFAGYTAEIFRSGVESIDRGQSEAGAAMGFGRVATFAHIVLPQTVQRVMPVYRGEFISLVKMTAIVGYIAVQDLAKAGDIIRSRTFDAFFPLIVVAVLYFVLAWLLMLGLEYLERCLNPQRGARS